MKKALLATIMAFLVSSVSYADELRLEASASAKLGDNTLTVEEQVRHDLSISEDMVTKAAPYEHTVFAIGRSLGDNNAVQLRVRNTNTNGTSENRLSLDLNSNVSLPYGIGVDNRLRLQLDETADITTVTTGDMRLREQISLTRNVTLPFLSVDLAVGDEIHVDETGIKENRVIASAATEVTDNITAKAEYFRQMMTEGDDANVVWISAALRF
jgi:opacity protein-like surface antigen